VKTMLTAAAHFSAAATFAPMSLAAVAVGAAPTRGPSARQTASAAQGFARPKTTCALRHARLTPTACRTVAFHFRVAVAPATARASVVEPSRTMLIVAAGGLLAAGLSLGRFAESDPGSAVAAEAIGLAERRGAWLNDGRRAVDEAQAGASTASPVGLRRRLPEEQRAPVSVVDAGPPGMLDRQAFASRAKTGMLLAMSTGYDDKGAVSVSRESVNWLLTNVEGATCDTEELLGQLEIGVPPEEVLARFKSILREKMDGRSGQSDRAQSPLASARSR